MGMLRLGLMCNGRDLDEQILAPLAKTKTKMNRLYLTYVRNMCSNSSSTPDMSGQAISPKPV